MTETEYVALARKAYHPSKLTDRELAQLRRSSRTGAKLLNKIVDEQNRRGLLSRPIFSNGRPYKLGGIKGYWSETVKRIGDYPLAQKSPRLF